MQNINPTNSITRRGRYYLFLGLLALFGGAIALVLGILFLFFPLWEALWFDVINGLLLLGGVVGILAGIAGIYRALTLQKDNPISKAVGDGLAQFLDHRYTYLRNVSKRGVGYIDGVLVGPPGALVFRIVDYVGQWRNERAQWFVQTRDGRIKPANQNPTRECVDDVLALRKFLKKYGLESVPVYGIVVFEKSNVQLSAADPVVPIAEISTLYRIMLRDYLVDERIAPPVVTETVNAIIDG